jgi:hypothetical protein
MALALDGLTPFFCDETTKRRDDITTNDETNDD